MISHKEKLAIIYHLVKKENLNGSAFGREIKILNSLLKNYDDFDFWIKINLDFELNSLAWFKNDGKVELEKKWRLFIQEKKQKVIDIIDKGQKMLEAFQPEEKFKPIIPLKNQTVFDWIDSK